MFFAEKFLLFTASYTAVFADRLSAVERAELLKEVQNVSVREEKILPDEAALSYVLWKAELGPKPSFIR